MERGVVVGGLLISGSFLLAVLFNHSARESATKLNQERAVEAAKAAAPDQISAVTPCCGPEEKCAAENRPPATRECPDSTKPASADNDTP